MPMNAQPLAVDSRQALANENARPQGEADVSVEPWIVVERVDTDRADALLALCSEHAARGGSGEPAFGPVRSDDLELREALFDTPTRVWAWIARIDGEPVGYVAASAGSAPLQRANYFRIEALYARADALAVRVERQLFAQSLRMARRLGCLNLQWQLPAEQAARLASQLPTQVVRTATVHHVLAL